MEDRLEELTRFCFVVHQTGKGNFTPLEKGNYFRAPYFNEELFDIMAAADGALSRAGAAAIWEMAASRTPMLLLPLVKGSRGDQIYNARIFEAVGAARVLKEDELSGDAFTGKVRDILGGSRPDWEAIHGKLKMGRAQDILIRTIEEDLAR